MRMEVEKINGIEEESQTPPRTQVFKATHDGENRLPLMRRSFISFSYGGKNIEDFNLLVTFGGDRLQKDAYGSFDDLTTTYDTIPGQFYWGSYYRTGSLSFTLSTDGITQKELDNFKSWFQPGPGKELILAEHPNRAIIARVSAPPQINLLPFESKVSINVGANTYMTSTTLYKGDISLDFVMDDPFWYSKQNIFPYVYFDEGTQWSAHLAWYNGRFVKVTDSPDALKIVYEDQIPLGKFDSTEPLFVGDQIYSNSVIIPLDTPITSTNLDFGESAYLYYSGTAPAPAIIKFQLEPIFDANGYIVSPINKYTEDETPYNTITLTAVNEHKFEFTAPSLYSSYNEALYVFDELLEPVTAWLLIRDYIRTRVKHPVVRAWANRVIDRFDTDRGGGQIPNGSVTGLVQDLKDGMKYLFLDGNNELMPAEFEFNARTGKAKGSFTLRDYSLITSSYAEETETWAEFLDGTGENFMQLVEDVGDMVNSNYLILDERNTLDDSYTVQKRTEQHPDYSYEITHDVENGLKNLSFEYKNLYL